MSRRAAATLSAHDELVPLSERQRWLAAYRLGLAGLVAVVAVLSPAIAPLGAAHTAIAAGAYALWSALASQAWRLPRRQAITAVGLALVIDGVFLAAISYAVGGIGTHLQYLLLTQLVTVTLLASFRTGFKVAAWHTLLVSCVFELQRAGVIHVGGAAARPTWSDVVIFAALITAVTVATASFAAVNERELRRRNYDLDALARLAWQLESTLDPEAVAKALVESLQGDFDGGRVLVLASDSGNLACLHGSAPVVPIDVLADHDRIVWVAMRQRGTVRVRGLDPLAEPWTAAAMPGALNVLVSPLFADGGPVGVVLCEYKRRSGSRIPRRSVSMIERCVSYTSLALNNAWLHGRINALAATDDLTGLANRRTFDTELDRELSRAIRQGSSVGCAMVDIDHFKKINDRFGHQVGDDVLGLVASAVATVCRPTDIVARYGGEELAVILPGINPEGLRAVGERIRQAIAAVDSPVPVTASIGMARFPESALDARELVGAADKAMYQAKDAGRDRIAIAAVLASADLAHKGS